MPESIPTALEPFVPPFPGSIAHAVAPDSGFCRRHGAIQPFLAWRDGKPVGRIAAIRNDSHNRYWNDTVGFFGFFESIDDPEVSESLFAAASAWLRKEGRSSMRGPYNPSINETCGLQTAGFDEIPTVSMPANPAYYADLFEQSGLRPVRELAAFDVRLDSRSPERIHRVAARTLRRINIKLRSIRMNRLEEELRIVRELYNLSLDRNWGFVPILDEDLQEAASDLRAIARPELILIVEIDGQPVGLGMALPNIAEALQAARRRRGLLRLLELAWRIKFTQPRYMRLAVLGVHPEYRDRAIGALIYSTTFVRGAELGFEFSEVSWIDEDNREILHAIKAMGCRRTKTYRIFERQLP